MRLPRVGVDSLVAGSAEQAAVGLGVVVCLEWNVDGAAALADGAVALEEHAAECCLDGAVSPWGPVAGW